MWISISNIESSLKYLFHIYMIIINLSCESGFIFSTHVNSCAGLQFSGMQCAHTCQYLFRQAIFGCAKLYMVSYKICFTVLNWLPIAWYFFYKRSVSSPNLFLFTVIWEIATKINCVKIFVELKINRHTGYMFWSSRITS